MHSHTASLSTISSIVTILFITCLSWNACGATSQKLQHHQQQQQQQQPQALLPLASPAAPTTTSTATSNQNDELLRQLLTLASSNQQQPAADLAQETNELKFNNAEGLAAAVASKKSKSVAALEARLAAESAKQRKLAIKRRLHKLVDEIVDESVAADEALKEITSAASHRKALAQNQQVQELQQQQLEKDDGLMLVMKRKPLNGINELDGNDLFGQQQQQQTQTQSQPPRQPTSEHARNILDDSFGIRRDSIFSSNNHLGLKGVPKFGSEEQF